MVDADVTASAGSTIRPAQRRERGSSSSSPTRPARGASSSTQALGAENGGGSQAESDRRPANDRPPRPRQRQENSSQRHDFPPPSRTSEGRSSSLPSAPPAADVVPRHRTQPIRPVAASAGRPYRASAADAWRRSRGCAMEECAAVAGAWRHREPALGMGSGINRSNPRSERGTPVAISRERPGFRWSAAGSPPLGDPQDLARSVPVGRPIAADVGAEELGRTLVSRR